MYRLFRRYGLGRRAPASVAARLPNDASIRHYNFPRPPFPLLREKRLCTFVASCIWPLFSPLTMELRSPPHPRAASPSARAARGCLLALFFFSAVVSSAVQLSLASSDAPSEGGPSTAAAAGASGGEAVPRLSPEKLSELMQLDIEEIKRRMAVLFDLIDLNKDNAIDMTEAKEWSVRLRDAMQKHQVSATAVFRRRTLRSLASLRVYCKHWVLEPHVGRRSVKSSLRLTKTRTAAFR